MTSQPFSGWPWSWKFLLSYANSMLRAASVRERPPAWLRSQGIRFELLRRCSPSLSPTFQKGVRRLAHSPVHGAVQGNSWDCHKYACFQVRVQYWLGRSAGSGVFVPPRARILCHGGVGYGSRKHGQDVGPFAFAFCEISKSARHRRPAAEPKRERVSIVFSLTLIDMTWELAAVSEDGAVSSHDPAPILE